jgi:biopolymer transport protein ExbD
MAFKRPPQDEAKLNLTPMIDMTFLLVVFFMLTIDLTQKEFVPVDLPFARSGVEDKENKEIPRLTVNLLARGDIKFKGNTYKLATGSPAEQRGALVALRNELQRLTAAQEFREADKSSMIPVMIHGDRNARWQYVQWIMQVCAEPTIGVYKIQFAVKGPPPTGATGEN